MPPNDARELRKLVVIGDNATARHSDGGNSSAVKTLYEITPLEGLRNRLPAETEVLFFQGYPPINQRGEAIPAQYLGIADPGAGTHGWAGNYCGDRHWNAPIVRQAVGNIDFDWTNSAPFPEWEPGEYTIGWDTTLRAPVSGVYEFVLEGANDAYFNFDGQALIQKWEVRGPDVVSRAVHLEAGRSYAMGVGVQPSGRDVRVRLGWIPPWVSREKEDIGALLDAVREADAVVFFGGQNHQYDVEGSDRRDMALHDGQNELLEQIAGINPRTVVVLVGGAPVEMP